MRSTALHLAAGGGHTAVVQALVRAGVSPSPPWQPSPNPSTLHSMSPVQFSSVCLLSTDTL